MQELKDRIKPGLGQGYGYDQKHITASKAELTTARADLLADADSLLTDMKKELFAKTAGKKVLEFRPNPEQHESDLNRDRRRQIQRTDGLLHARGTAEHSICPSRPAS